MSAVEPISPPEMADVLHRCLSAVLGDIADPPHGASFECIAPATGQRFRVIVAEIPAWTDRLDRELAEVVGSKEVQS